MNARFLPVLARAVMIVALLYLVLPLVAVIPLSLTDQRLLALPVEGLSTKHYQTLFQSADWLDAAWQSLQIAIATTVVAVSAGTASAIGCWLMGNPSFFRVLNLLPIMVPYIIFALGAYRMFAAIGILDTVLGVVIVHVIGAIPFVFVSVSTNLEYVDRSLVRAARSLGARPLRAAVTVILPNVKTGLFSGAVFAFLHSWDEIVRHPLRVRPQRDHAAAQDVGRAARRSQPGHRLRGSHPHCHHGVDARDRAAHQQDRFRPVSHNCHPERSEGPLRRQERSLAALGMTVEGVTSLTCLRPLRA